jgi:flagellar hook-associated protein 3 FlgL
LNLNWGLLAANGAGIIPQTAAVSAQTAQSQNGSAGVNNVEAPTDSYSNVVSTLGATVPGVQAENTAQTNLMQADVAQVSTQLSLSETQQTALPDVIAKLDSSSNSLFNKLQ